MPPAYVGAQIWLTGTYGGEMVYTGITHFRRRVSNDADEDVESGDYWNWPVAIVEYVSSVTSSGQR